MGPLDSWRQDLQGSPRPPETGGLSAECWFKVDTTLDTEDRGLGYKNIVCLKVWIFCGFLKQLMTASIVSLGVD